MKKRRHLIILLRPLHKLSAVCAGIFLFLSTGCANKDVHRDGTIKLRGERPVEITDAGKGDLIQKGIASWYGRKFHGRKTANGEVYDMMARTAAHKTLPFGTILRVVNRTNNRFTQIRINDRGPFVKGRIIDLSKQAAIDIGLIGPGTAEVGLYLVESPEKLGLKERPNGYFTVQAGSFENKQSAEKFKKRLKNEFHDPVFIWKYQGMYRVRIGKFKQKRHADPLIRRLESNGIPHWLVFMEKNP